MVIPSVGDMVGVIVENRWLVIVIPAVLVLIAFLPWGRLDGNIQGSRMMSMRQIAAEI